VVRNGRENIGERFGSARTTALTSPFRLLKTAPKEPETSAARTSAKYESSGELQGDVTRCLKIIAIWPKKSAQTGTSVKNKNPSYEISARCDHFPSYRGLWAATTSAPATTFRTCGHFPSYRGFRAYDHFRTCDHFPNLRPLPQLPRLPRLRPLPHLRPLSEPATTSPATAASAPATSYRRVTAAAA
jgi:hypothetical protein